VADEISVDSLGNAVAVLNPGGRPKVMLDAHIDELGFLIKYIDDDGYLYFHTIGGFDAATLTGNRVQIMGNDGPVLGVVGGRKPIHLLDADERKKSPEIKAMWIDIGARSRAEAEALINIGDAGGRVHAMSRLQGNLVTSAALDDRVGCYMVAETLRALAASEPTAAVYAASSVQEEIGLRGARVSAFSAEASVGIALEVTWTTDYPQAPKAELGSVRVGAGPVFTRGANVNPRVYERLVAAAEAEGAAYQVEAHARGTPTDLDVMQLTRGGMATGLISIPTRYLHTASEVLSLDDVDAAVAILTRFVRDLDESANLTP
jgi:endoglucanase